MEDDDFFDAQSLLGSLQQAFSSAMSASGLSLGGASLAPGGEAGSAAPDEQNIFAMHDLAASIREVRGGGGSEAGQAVQVQVQGRGTPHAVPGLLCWVVKPPPPPPCMQGL